MKKRMLLLCLISLFIFTVQVKAENSYTNKMGVTMNDIEIENLKNLGFSDFEISTMELEEFNLIKT